MPSWGNGMNGGPSQSMYGGGNEGSTFWGDDDYYENTNYGNVSIKEFFTQSCFTKKVNHYKQIYLYSYILAYFISSLHICLSFRCYFV